jgi:hypothetical protein
MRYRLFYVCLALAPATPATAAPGTDRDTRDVFESFTACVVKGHVKEAADVVLSTLPTDAIIKQHPNMVDPGCLDPTMAGELHMPSGDFLRYGLAEQLVRQEYAGGLPADFARAGPIRHKELNPADYQPKAGQLATPRLLAKLDEERKRDIAIQTLSIFGECTVRADPPGSLALILSNPASKAEAAAFAGLQPALSSCLTKGATIQLDKAAIRGSIAMNLYRLAKAPRVSAPVAAVK